MPLIRALPALALTAALLVGCRARTHDQNGNETASISFGDGNANAQSNFTDKAVVINVPGFSAKISVPGLDLTGKDTDIDGIPLYPGTRMTGVNINATGNDGTGGESQGRVDMGFSAPASPDAVIGYYRGAAKTAGWTEQPPAAGQQFAATKPDDKAKTTHLAMVLTGAAGGSNGHFTIDGN